MYKIFSELMEEKGLTAYKVSKETGISQSVLSAWKNGTSVPRPVTFKILADYLGVSVEYLRGETSERTAKEKPADQVADGLDQETVALAEKIREAAPGVKRLLDSILNEGGKGKSDIQKIKITCPIDGSEQVIYQPGYRIGSIFIPECGNNGCEMCHPCNECTICRLKAVSSSLPDLDIK